MFKTSIKLLPLILTLSLWQCSADDLINYLIPQAPDPCLNAGSVSSPFECGSGTRDDPYRISQAGQLEALGRDIPNSDMYYSAHFWLANSIDMEGIAMSPIGGGTAIDFTGAFNGGGHVIENLTINLSGQDEVGLFGVIGAGGTVRNLSLDNISIMGDNDVGSLVGFNDGGNISNIYVKTSPEGSVMGMNERVGGLAGRNINGNISNSYAAASATGTINVGGLVGVNNNTTNGTISNSYAVGSVTGTGNQIGGLAGRNTNGNISNSYATGSVTGMGDRVGGLVGENDDANISNSFATGNVTGMNNNVGGLVGRSAIIGAGSTMIRNSYATGDVTGTGNNVGGFAGQNMNGTISNSYAVGSVTGTGDQIGGLVGQNDDADISNSFAAGNVTGDNNVGGLVGRSTNNSTISNSFAAGSVTGMSSDVGGLAGRNTGGGTISGANYFVDSDGGANGLGSGTCTGTCEIRKRSESGLDLHLLRMYSYKRALSEVMVELYDFHTYDLVESPKRKYPVFYKFSLGS